MPSGYEVFDADEVLFEARRSVSRMRCAVIGAAVLTVLVVLAGMATELPRPTILGVLTAGWLAGGAWGAYHLQCLHRVAWCLRLSAQGVEAYDYTRHRLRLPWSRLQRVECTDAGLRLIGPEGQRIRVPDRFPDFPDLSHHIVRRAEDHDVPLWVDGRPYQDLDVYTLFPFLADDASYGAAGMRHRA